MKNLIYLAGGAAALYFLGSASDKKNKELRARKNAFLSDWHNPDHRFEMVGIEYRINSVRISVDFSIFFEKEFKNNRLAGEIFYLGDFIKNIRESKNWKVKGDGYNAINYDFIIGAEIWNKFPGIENLIQTYEFWENFRIRGNFEAKNGDRIYFDSYIIVPPQIKTEFRPI